MIVYLYMETSTIALLLMILVLFMWNSRGKNSRCKRCCNKKKSGIINHLSNI